MYTLRKINPHYVEHADCRSDALVLQHPEFTGGKVRAQYGPGKLWDETRPRCHPRRSPVADRVHRAGSRELVRRVAQRTEDWRLDASRKTMRLDVRTPEVGRRAKTFGEFIETLGAMDQLPDLASSTTGIRAGSSNNRKHIGPCRHYDSLHEELNAVRDRLKCQPEATKKLLIGTGSWKFWAEQLEQADQQRRKTQQLTKSKSSVM